MAIPLAIASGGLIAGDARVVAAATAVLGGWLLLAEARFVSKEGGWSPLASYALFVAITGIANTVGLFALNGAHEWSFDLYSSREHLLPAMFIALLEGSSVAIGFCAVRSWWRRAGVVGLPEIKGHFGRAGSALPLGLLGILAALLNWSGVLLLVPLAGSLGTTVRILPVLTIFALTYRGAIRKSDALLTTAMLVNVIETARAISTEYLRLNMILPSSAFVLGLTAGSALRRRFALKYLGPIVVFGILFVSFFATFGAARTDLGRGAERLQRMYQAHAEDEEDTPGLVSVLVRSTSFNQLSRVYDLTRTEGLYGGQTLEYLSYAFIPRFLWPSKPVIQKGGWFASEIGLGKLTENDRHSNSINMTIGGELYLNFGWLGLVVGGVLIGALLAAFWAAAGFGRRQDEMSTLYSAYLFFVSFSLGADLQMLVSMIATYLILLAASRLMSKSRPQRVRTRMVIARQPHLTNG